MSVGTAQIVALSALPIRYRAELVETIRGELVITGTHYRIADAERRFTILRAAEIADILRPWTLQNLAVWVPARTYPHRMQLSQLPASVVCRVANARLIQAHAELVSRMSLGFGD